jgi:hypothetical protein
VSIGRIRGACGWNSRRRQNASRLRDLYQIYSMGNAFWFIVKDVNHQDLCIPRR